MHMEHPKCEGLADIKGIGAGGMGIEDDIGKYGYSNKMHLIEKNCLKLLFLPFSKCYFYKTNIIIK